MIFFRKKESHSFAKIFTFYNERVNPEVPKMQQAVFNKFGIHINQVYQKKVLHGAFMNQICRNVKNTDYLIFFDVDCIPTRKEWMELLLRDLSQQRTLVGAAQTANWQKAENLYVSPFFMGISTAYLRELNYPDMLHTEHIDTGQNLTHAVEQNAGSIKYWWPSHIEDPVWELHDDVHTKFGPGTTYNDCIYHAFYSRVDRTQRFFNKCKEILNSN